MTRKLFIGFIAVLAVSLWFVGCTTSPAPDEIPPVVTIDSPDPGASFCDGFTVEGTATDVDPGLGSVTLFVDGVEVETVSLNQAASYNFQFDVGTADFPADCGDVVVEVVAKDGEGNEATAHVTVTLCDDTTDPVVTLSADDDYLTAPDQCAHITVTVDEPNFADYTVTGYGGVVVPTDTGYQFTACGSELNVGENTILFTVTDFCGNEGFGSIVITFDPQAPVVTNIAPADGSVLCEAVTFQAAVDFQDRENAVVDAVTFWVDGNPYAGVENGDNWEVSFANAWENWSDGGPYSWYAEAETNVGNATSDPQTFTVSCVDPVVEITAPMDDECLCGDATFTADAAYRDLPGITSVEFWFDGELTPRGSDDSAPYEYSTNVTNTFEPAPHTVYAVAVLESGDRVPSAPVSWVKSCEPSAVLQWVMQDNCNRTVTVNAGLSSDDNTEPGLTYEFWAESGDTDCEGHWSHNQAAPNQSQVTFTFDPDFCGYGDVTIYVKVFDGWCDGSDTASLPVTFVDNCLGAVTITDPSQADQVYGDSQATWPLLAEAYDRDLTDPALTAVDFYYSDDVLNTDPQLLCNSADNGDGTWGCDFDSGDLAANGGYYYFFAQSTDNANPANTLWSSPVRFWKSDMPVIGDLDEEHADGNYYDNGYISLPFTVRFTDDNLSDAVTSYDVVWDFSDGGHYVTTVGPLDPGVASITHSFSSLGSYSLDVQVVETTPVGLRTTVTSQTETWSICLENDPPAVDSFDVENITFVADEGPYHNDWVNPNNFLVSDEREDLGINFAADDVDVGNCVSGCDYYTIDFHSGVWTDQQVTLTCGSTDYNVDWNAFSAGDWDVTFTIYDKAGNTATATETVTKSDYPQFSTLDFYTNEWPYNSGNWSCFEDPVGIPVRFYDWNSTDDSGYPIDSLLFEFDNGTDVWTEEIFSYDPSGFSLPWVYWFDNYDDLSARIWACDQWGQWSVSNDFQVNLQDTCAPDQPEIDQVDDAYNPVVPIATAWDRADVQSSNTNIHIQDAVGDRNGESGPFGHSGPAVSRIEIVAFNPVDGYNGDPNYWTNLYGSGYDGPGTSAYTGTIATLNGSGPGNAMWDADGSFYGICGWFYIYAVAIDVNGNYSEPSFPVVMYKYSLPEFADCYVTDVGAELCMAVTMECSDDAEYTYDWHFGDGSPDVIDGGASQCHTFTLAALRTVSVDYFVDGNPIGTTETWVSVGDTQDPFVTNLDIAPYHPVDAPNDNEGNEGTKNAQYGTMYYDVTAIDDGILQGPGGASDPAITIELWSDDDGLPGGNPSTFIENVTDIYNQNCMDNEVEGRFSYNWNGKDRGYYWLRARAHDRSGNDTGEDTPTSTDDYLNLQLFHSDPPGSAETGGVLEVVGDYTNLHTLEFDVTANVSDEVPGSIKYQWDRKTDLRCSEDGDWFDDPGFVYEYEFSDPTGTITYYEPGYGYDHYECTTSSGTSDGPAFRAVDVDGIYSQIILFPVDIQDVSEPRLQWQTPVCTPGTNLDGVITLKVWASDYPEYGRGQMPGISKVQFFVNDVYIETDATGVDMGDQEIDGLTGPTFEFEYTFDLSAFMDANFPPVFGGPVVFEARAFDIDGDQVGSRELDCIESNDPVLGPVGPCDMISGSQTVIFPFQNYFTDDNGISYLVVDWTNDGFDDTTIDWANAVNYPHNYGAWGQWTVAVKAYDIYGDMIDVILSTDVWTDNVAPSADWATGVPANGATCVSEDYPNDILITPSNVADNSGCLDRVEFYLSDNGNAGTYEYYYTAAAAPWDFPWYPFDQESKDIYVGIRVWDQAGNSFDFGIDDGSLMFTQDLKPWNPSIDHPEVWALLNADLELLGAGENDVNDPFDCIWDDDSDGTGDDTTNPVSESVDPHLAPTNVAGDYTLTMGLEDGCWTYNGGNTNNTTADIHVVDNVAPTITDFTVTPVVTKQATIDFDVQDIDGNGNCWWWDNAVMTITSNPEGDVLHQATFYSAYQWNPVWPDNVSYDDPCVGAENFTYTFDVGGFEDCDGPIGDVYVDVDGLPLGYNPYEDGDILDVNIDATDTEGNVGNFAYAITISDVLAPEAPADPAYWINPEPNATIVAGSPITVQVRPLDWHCATITNVEFYADEPAYDYASVNVDNFFGADTDVDADGIFEATTVLAVGNHTIGIFAWDDVVNESHQWFINVTVVAP